MEFDLTNLTNSSSSVTFDLDPTTAIISTTTTSPVSILAQLPANFYRLSAYSRGCVLAYLILFLIGAPGNLTIFFSVGRELWRRRHHYLLARSRLKVLIFHLASADLLVTFVVIPIEVGWRLTVAWYGGEFLCRFSQFLRAFGLYLSSMVIICISLDRFFAIIFPLKVIGGMRRVRGMLWVAWGSALLFASPQLLIFSVRRSVVYPDFIQCSNVYYFSSLRSLVIYNVASLFAMYFAPLFVILVTYALVFYKIFRKSRSASKNLRRSSNAASTIVRARRRTLWLSMVIVTVFVLCWSPYVVWTMWYLVDYEGADGALDPQLREVLFVTAVSNSCLNPIIYGNYMSSWPRKLLRVCCPRLQARARHAPNRGQVEIPLNVCKYNPSSSTLSQSQSSGKSRHFYRNHGEYYRATHL